MADYHVFLIDLVPAAMRRLTHFTPESRTRIAAYLTELFSGVCTGTDYLPVVAWGPGSPTPCELVVYFVLDRSASLTGEFGNSPAHDNAGTTWGTPQGVISEVYVTQAGPTADRIARVAFHELMHNKLECSQGATMRNLHTEGGGGLAAARIDPNTAPTPLNLELMRGALGREGPQYTARMRSSQPRVTAE